MTAPLFPIGSSFTVTTTAGSAVVTGPGLSATLIGHPYTIAGAGAGGTPFLCTPRSFDAPSKSVTLTQPVPVAVSNTTMTSAVTITLDDGHGHTQSWTTAGKITTASTSFPVLSQTPSFAFPAGTSVNIKWSDYRASFSQFHLWPDGATTNPATGSTAPSATVVNTAAGVGNLSNLMENQGPAVFVWASGGGGGANGTLSFRYQPTSLGQGLKGLNVDTLQVAWDTRYNTLVEYKPDLYATTNGEPWIVPANTFIPGTYNPATGKGIVWATTPVYPYGIPPSATLAFPLFTSGNTSALQVQSLQVAIPGGTVLTLTDPTGAFTQTWTTLATANVGDTTIAVTPATATFAFPVGSTLAGGFVGANFGGGSIRIFRQITPPTWTCVSALSPFAVPSPGGGPHIDSSGIIQPDPISGEHAGKIFGPTIKCQGATLASNITPGSTSFTVSGVVGLTGFRPQGGIVRVGEELMTFSTYSGTTITIQKRGQYGTAVVNHSPGEQVAGTVEGIVLSAGINQGAPVPTPFCAREWPVRVGPTAASVCLTADI